MLKKVFFFFFFQLFYLSFKYNVSSFNLFYTGTIYNSYCNEDENITLNFIFSILGFFANYYFVCVCVCKPRPSSECELYVHVYDIKTTYPLSLKWVFIYLSIILFFLSCFFFLPCMQPSDHMGLHLVARKLPQVNTVWVLWRSQSAKIYSGIIWSESSIYYNEVYWYNQLISRFCDSNSVL